VSAHFDQYLSCHEAVHSLAEEIRTHDKENQEFLKEMKHLKDITDSSLSIMLKRSKEQRRIRNIISAALLENLKYTSAAHLKLRCAVL
jgi:hypothetical protein